MYIWDNQHALSNLIGRFGITCNDIQQWIYHQVLFHWDQFWATLPFNAESQKHIENEYVKLC